MLYHCNKVQMFANDGPPSVYVEIPLKEQPFPPTMVIYIINNVYSG